MVLRIAIASLCSLQLATGTVHSLPLTPRAASTVEQVPPAPQGPTAQGREVPPPVVMHVVTAASDAAARAPARSVPGHGQVAAGVALVVASSLAYAAMGAGLIVGRQAESELSRLRGPDAVDRRRDVLARGRMGNALAIGAGLSAAIAMGAGVCLIILGRRKAKRAIAQRDAQ